VSATRRRPTRTAAKPAKSPARTNAAPRAKPASPARAAGPGADAANPRFFATPALWRAWLAKHHASTDVLWVGFRRVGSGEPSITWPQSVDEALCFGWIDGLRKSLDATSYAIRFTPRKTTSNWSAVNVRRMAELEREGRVAEAGRRAFAARREERTAIYTYEKRPIDLSPGHAKVLRANAAAWRWWSEQPPGYRKSVAWWIASAKQDATRERRLAQLVTCCAEGRPVPPYVPRLSPHVRGKVAGKQRP